MISIITLLVQSSKYEFFELILRYYILDTLSLSHFKWIEINQTAVKICRILELKIFFLFLLLQQLYLLT